jgi:hypothetical protein
MLAAVALAAALACIPEQATPFPDALDQFWIQAQAMAQIEKSPRPKFCFGWEPRGGKGSQRIVASYNRPTRTSVVSLTPEEAGVYLRCVAIHEMLHDLLGEGKERQVELITSTCHPRFPNSD